MFLLETRSHLPWKTSLHPQGKELLQNYTRDFIPIVITSDSEGSFPPQMLSKWYASLGALKQQVLWVESSFLQSNSSDSHLLNVEIHDLIVTVGSVPQITSLE